MTLAELRTACEHFPDGREFSTIVGAAVDLEVVTTLDLAYRFKTMRSAPGRWIKGRNRPHRLFQDRVVAHILALIPLAA
jgi:hypothetical protein